jgi:multiple sugar transport system substrate-binding protein
MITRALIVALSGAFLALAVAQESLTVVTSAGGAGRAFTAAAELFTQETGIQVNVIPTPYAEVREQQLLELVTGTGNLDLISLDGQLWLSDFVDFLEPIDVSDEELDRFVPAMVDLFRFGPEGTLYALPARVGGWVLMYRTDLFEEAGLEPPETWDDFLHAAQTLTGDGVYGFVPALQQGNFLVVQWIPFLRGFGADVLTEDHSAAAFNTEQGREATQFFVDLYLEHGVVPPGAIAYEHDGVIVAMQQGLGAMAITYSPNFLAMINPESSVVADRLAVSGRIPYDPDAGLSAGISEISGWGFGIARDSQNKELAQQFVDFVTSHEIQLRIALENANAPTLRSVYNDPEYIEVYPSAAEVVQALEGARTRPGVENWTLIEDILARELSMILAGSKSVEQALNDAEAAVNAALR